MVKIKEYKIQKHGSRGITITLPKVWVEDNRLDFGDTVEIYRDIDNRLILKPKGEQTQDDQAAELREKMREQA